MTERAGAETLRRQYEELAGRLEDGGAAGRRDALKAEIVDLFKRVDQELAQLTALKEDVKKLAERWKTLGATPAAGSARVSPSGPSASEAATLPGTMPAPRLGGVADAAAPTVPTPAASRPTTQSGPAQPAGGGDAPGKPSNAPEFPSARPVVRADHLNASSLIEKGWSLLAAGQHEKAEQSLVKALQFAPDDPQTESLLGWAQMLQEKYDEGLLNFQKVLMRQPTNALARINVGYICLKKRIFGEAIEHLSKAIRLDNDKKATLYAHFYLGLVYLEREMYEDAQTFFRKAIALGPNLIESYYELGRALWFNDQKDEAKQAWRDGLAANKFNPWGKRCGEMLQHVEAGGEPARGG